jgi:hypothetical protein
MSDDRRAEPQLSAAWRRVLIWWHEPLVQFVALGALLFLLWPFVADRVATRSNRIVIPAGEMQRAIDIFYQTHLRPPDQDELGALAEQQIEMEVYYREGLALGLDRNDEIIRRRIRQKLEFMTEDITDAAEPSEAELQRFLVEHAADFGAEKAIAFSQVYLNPDRHGAALKSDAERLLAHLNSADGRLDYAADSDVLPVPNDFEATPLHAIAAMFGDEFTATLAHQRAGLWVGPIRSGYGEHLVLVRDMREGKMPDLAQVRSRVLEEWHLAERKAANQRAYQRMRAKYLISVEMPDKLTVPSR